MTPIDTWKLCLDISNQDGDGDLPKSQGENTRHGHGL